jgi:ribonuclease HI
VHKSAEFKKFLQMADPKPDIICIQETWLKDKWTFNIPGYMCIRRDRVTETSGGGCLILVRNTLQVNPVPLDTELEAQCIEINHINGKLKILNFYNPGNNISVDQFTTLFRNLSNVIICGDFNAHHNLWGGNHNDSRGNILEEVLDELDFVMLNDGTGTRYDSHTKEMSALDLTFCSSNLAPTCTWEVSDNNLGSDHHLIYTKIRVTKIEEENFNFNWSMKSADWAKFNFMCSENVHEDLINDDINVFNDNLISAVVENADKCIAQSKCKSKIPVPYWNKGCDEAIRARNKAFRQARKTRDYSDNLQYRKLKAKARYTVNNSKKSSWQQFCTTINNNTKLSKVWRVIKKIGGKISTFKIPTLKCKDTSANSNKEKANMFANHFVNVSSTNNYSEKFKKHKKKFEKENSNILNDNTEFESPINEPFSMAELKQALTHTKETSPGGDRLCYKMFRKMPMVSLYIILNLFNLIWTKGCIPDSWKKSIVIPIHKNGKNTYEPISYRPIALTSNLCKLMEKLVTNRIVWYLEKHKMLNNLQCAFRKKRTCTDHLLRIQDKIYKSLNNGQSVLALFLDIEKAYDMVWKEGLLFKLHKLGIKGKAFWWIRDFLKNRSIQVRVGVELSDPMVIENGIPQGSAISPLLFIIMINDLNVSDQNTSFSLFADDCAVWMSGKNIQFLSNKMQKILESINNWCNLWGFKISIAKTVYMIFTRKLKVPDINLYLDEEEIQGVNKFKFLGLVFDPKLSWNEHIKDVVNKCKNVLNVFRCLRGSTWGVDRKSLLILYKSLIRSRLDYGCRVYGDAHKTILNKLNVIQSTALRLSTGAARSTPINALQVETGEMPLHLRREMLSLKYRAKLQAQPTHPTNEILKDSWHNYYCKNPDQYKPFGVRTGEFDFNIQIAPLQTLPIPPWHIQTPRILYDVNKSITKKDLPALIKSTTLEFINSNLGAHLQIYTDGSKTKDGVGSAFFIPEFNICRKYTLPNYCSVFVSELMAILKVLQWIEDVMPNRAVILSDSLSALNAIEDITGSSREDLVYDIVTTLTNLNYRGIDIQLAWVPAHSGIPGNERVDMLAKEAADGKGLDTNINYHFTDIYKQIDNYILNRWQELWETSDKGRHYFNINNTVSTKNQFSYTIKRHEVVITKLRLGHCRLNHILFKTNQHENGLCATCLTPETIHHFLFDCLGHQTSQLALSEKIKDLNNVFNIKEILNEPIYIPFIIDIIKEAGKVSTM